MKTISFFKKFNKTTYFLFGHMQLFRYYRFSEFSTLNFFSILLEIPLIISIASKWKPFTFSKRLIKRLIFYLVIGNFFVIVALLNSQLQFFFYFAWDSANNLDRLKMKTVHFFKKFNKTTYFLFGLRQLFRYCRFVEVLKWKPYIFSNGF